jgi:hypothetical protein
MENEMTPEKLYEAYRDGSGESRTWIELSAREQAGWREVASEVSEEIQMLKLAIVGMTTNQNS